MSHGGRGVERARGREEELREVEDRRDEESSEGRGCMGGGVGEDGEGSGER